MAWRGLAGSPRRRRGQREREEPQRACAVGSSQGSPHCRASCARPDATRNAAAAAAHRVRTPRRAASCHGAKYAKLAAKQQSSEIASKCLKTVEIADRRLSRGQLTERSRNRRRAVLRWLAGLRGGFCDLTSWQSPAAEAWQAAHGGVATRRRRAMGRKRHARSDAMTAS